MPKPHLLPPVQPFIADPREAKREASLRRFMAGLFDAAWYRQRYPDVAATDLDPLQHFIRHGAAEKRDPNRFFDSEWYSECYPDVQTSGLHPLLHYLQIGAIELRNPHPAFDAVYYAAEHPEAAANPLLYHLRVGLARGYLTQKPIDIRDYLPSVQPPPALPRKVAVDVVIPVYRGAHETRRCVMSVLADAGEPLARIIVVDDRSPETALIEWLRELAAEGRILLIRSARNAGFVASVNAGMMAAGTHDVVLLNSDTEVPAGWLRRLTAQAYARPRIATVSPFSNNATICGYPDNEGGPIVFGHSVAQVDEVCRTVNQARWVDIPTTVGFCMYIRREALVEIGTFDVDRFGAGYGEENDFCLRATAMGWQHRLACDIFVYHKGAVSFAGRSDELAARAMELILERNPEYSHRVAHHVSLGAVTPFRFAVTAGLFRASGRPVILMISHNLGGGVRRHIDKLTERYASRAHFLLLEATGRGAALSVPALADHPVLTMPPDRLDDLALLLRSMAVSRIHVHHTLGFEMDVRGLVHRLGLPFDLTVHDYYAICPQINFLPWPDSPYCGEPELAACNACIAARATPDAHDILTWRAERSWQFLEADRVLCPSQDAIARLRRYGLDGRAVLAPHEPVAFGPWPRRVTSPGAGKMRIAVLGVLADHKGARTVAAVAEAADPKSLEIHLIGHTESDFPPSALKRLRITGEYDDASLPKLIARAAPHLIWFPTVAPETYSYTLSAAIGSGIPIVATEIGAFTERLAGRPFTWLARGYISPEDWIGFFETVRTALDNPGDDPPPVRPAVADFYASEYLRPAQTPPFGSPPGPTPVPATMPASCRAPDPSRLPTPVAVRFRANAPQLTVAVVPERHGSSVPTPCAYIRLLQPLGHPAIAGDVRVVLADAKSVLEYDVDAIVTQRNALPTAAAADALIAHARSTGAALVYDLDDDLLNIPPSHPEATELRPRARIVGQMLRESNAVWLSTRRLAEALGPIGAATTLIGNGLDERIWPVPPDPEPIRDEPLRILCMGTSTHTRDFALIEPALARLHETYAGRVRIDIVGMTTRDTLAPGLNRVGPPPNAGQSYPGFVNWLTSVRPGWHVGLAPLLDTPFNRAKSSIKTMDYAALGLAVLASDVPAYHGSLADGVAGRLVINDPKAWFAALEEMLRNHDLRRAIAAAARPAFLRHATLASQAATWREALASLPRRSCSA